MCLTWGGFGGIGTTTCKVNSALAFPALFWAKQEKVPLSSTEVADKNSSLFRFPVPVAVFTEGFETFGCCVVKNLYQMDIETLKSKN